MDSRKATSSDGDIRPASLLFTPLALRDVVLRNRVMISAMCQYSADREGMAGDWHLVHYGRFAQGGAGMVVLEATAIAPQGRLGYGDLGIWSDDHIPALNRIARFVEGEGAVPAIQIAHSGRKASSQRPWHGNGPLGEEDLRERAEALWETESVTDERHAPGFPKPAAMSLASIAKNLDLWREAAARACRAGFKALEIHGAHGYLVHSFLSPLSNTRTDAYGGSLAGRMRFALEVVDAVRSVWPSNLPLLFRISSVDAAKQAWSIGDSIVLARELKSRGVDVIDCSSGGIGGDLSVIPRGPGFQVPFAEQIRADADIATAAVGLIIEPAQAESILAKGQADLVAIGREALVNPNWPLHAMRALEPQRKFDAWPQSSGWWLNRRKAGVQAPKA